MDELTDEEFGSPSSRRAWIEIISLTKNTSRKSVALLAEGVDRNNYTVVKVAEHIVALLAEGVDRNK